MDATLLSFTLISTGPRRPVQLYYCLPGLLEIALKAGGRSSAKSRSSDNASANKKRKAVPHESQRNHRAGDCKTARMQFLKISRGQIAASMSWISLVSALIVARIDLSLASQITFFSVCHRVNRLRLVVILHCRCVPAKCTNIC